MDLLELIAIGMTAVGDLFVLLALGCAILLIAFNVINSVSSYRRPIPVQIVVGGWLCFLVSLAGLVAVAAADTDVEEIGLVLGWSAMATALLVLLVFFLLAAGSFWQLRGHTN